MHETDTDSRKAFFGTRMLFVGILVLLISLLIGLTLPNTAYAANGTIAGSGTKADPYKIDDLADLEKFRDNINGGITTYKDQWVVLTANITVNNATWVPIGVSAEKCFKGIFDGNDHSIDGVIKKFNVTYKEYFDYGDAWRVGNCSLTFKIDYGNWKRLEGADRYKTSAAILREGFADNSSQTVIVATGENYPDALAASALSGLENAPIVLTPKSGLTREAKDEITRLGATKVVIIGSESAVSKKVETEAGSLVSTVERIAGKTRIETALEIYKKGAGRWSNTAIVACSTNFADALSISSYAYAKQAPIFLADGNKVLTDEALSAIKNDGFSNIIIVGSDKVVAETTVDQLKGIGLNGKNIKRLAGTDRYLTSEAIAHFVISEGLTADNITLATGENFPDALSGSSLCGSKNSAILLLPGRTGSFYGGKFLATYTNAISNFYYLGGENVLETMPTEVGVTTVTCY